MLDHDIILVDDDDSMFDDVVLYQEFLESV